MTKLSANMTRTLIAVAEMESGIVWGRDKATAIALENRGLISVNGEMHSEGSGVGLVVAIKEAGFEMAVELV